ncbi:MAG: FG-GAP-like repeat-containing protein [Nitrospira sp.]
MNFLEQTGSTNPFAGIDVGFTSTPTLGDLDGDGDLDLVVGEYQSTLTSYQNTGTAGAPSYTEQTGSANPFTGINVEQFSTPTLGDLDGDGDLDLVVGEYQSTLTSYQNTGTAGAPSYTEQTGSANPFTGINVEQFSTPTLGDLDGDGDLDLVVGEYQSTLTSYQNTGTAGAPSYTEQTGSANPFTGINVGSYSSPTVGDLDGDGDPGRRLDGDGDLDRCRVIDLDGDGDLDLIVGNYDGTLRTYLNVTNRAPVAVADALSTTEDSGLTGNVLSANPTTADRDPDGDTVTVSQVNGSAATVGTEIALGSGLLTVQASGAVSFNPNGGYDALAQGASTTESFTYQIADGKGGTADATVTVTITGVNDAPVAGADTFVATQGTPLTIAVASLLANDSDVDQGTTPAITAVGQAVQGSVTLSDNGTPSDRSDDMITFTPTGPGAGGFQYTLSDGLTDVQGIVSLTLGTRQVGGNGNDALTGNAGPDALDGGNGNDRLIGNAGDDTLRGGNGNDRLIGNAGDDTLLGGLGDDLLVGGTGADSLTGGLGGDTFRFALADSPLVGFDQITDLQIGTDRLDGPSAVRAANLRELGAVTALTQDALDDVLTAETFAADGAATFSIGSRTFLALNDGTAGFQQETDAVIELVGFTGNLTTLAIL